MKHVEELLEEFEELEEEFPEEYVQKGRLISRQTHILESPSDGFKCVNIRDMIVNILTESADVLLFGSTDYPKVKDLPIPEAIDELYTICADHIEYSMANFLTFGLWSYFRMTPTIRNAYKFGDQIKDAIA